MHDGRAAAGRVATGVENATTIAGHDAVAAMVRAVSSAAEAVMANTDWILYGRNSKTMACLATSCFMPLPSLDRSLPCHYLFFLHDNTVIVRTAAGEK